MAEFPRDEQSTITLAELASTGMRNNQTVFPNPPKDPAVILQEITEYRGLLNDIQAADAAKRQLVQDKNGLYAEIRHNLRDNIDYVEIVANGDEAILELAAWGNRAPAHRLTAPGQCRIFEIIGLGADWMRVDWKEPIDGGKPASYIVRRSEDGINFVDAATVAESIAILVAQPTGKKLIYHVVAMNRAGEGIPSNTVIVTF